MSRNTKPPKRRLKNRNERGKSRPHAKHYPNADGEKYGIPRWLRRYQVRYGNGGVAALIAEHRKNPGPLLDHGRDRAARFRKTVADYLKRSEG